MKTILFKTILLFTFMFTITVNAQQQNKKEKFIVIPEVIIDIDTRYTDIEIETWNKNEVIVESFLIIDGEEITEEIRKDLYNKWELKVFGNSSKINIKSKSNNHIDIYSFNFDNPNYEFFYTDGDDFKFECPDVSISSLRILDSFDFLMPEIPELPELPEFPELPEMPVSPPMPPIPTDFDFDAYRNDKNYLEQWKKENEGILGKNVRIKVGKNSISINSDSKNSSYRWNITTEGQEQFAKEIEEGLSKAMKSREKSYEKRQEAYKKRQKLSLERNKELVKINKRRNEARKLAYIKRRELLEERRNKMKTILKKREKIKIKRIVRIKAPKEAKFNMNVRYGTLSFPKN